MTAVSNTVGKGGIAENTYILVGREKGAEKLKELSVGDEVTSHTLQSSMEMH